MTAKVERTTVKLEDGDNFNKFVKYIPLKGYKKDEQPYIEKVMENQDGKWVNIDPQPWIDKLNEVLKVVPVSDEKIDFKLLSERQANELKSTKATLAAMNERIHALEAKKEPTEKEIRQGLFAKATEFGLTPAKNIKTDDLRKLIEEKENNK
jgi:hypothetical protein